MLSYTVNKGGKNENPPYTAKETQTKNSGLLQSFYSVVYHSAMFFHKQMRMDKKKIKFLRR